MIIFAIFIYIFLFLPILVLVLFSFNQAQSLSLWTGFSFKWYEQLFNDTSILEALVNSLEIAFLASIISGVVGVFVGLSHNKFIKKLPLIPIVLPDIIAGISLLSFFIWIQLPLGKVSVILAHSSFGVAYVSTFVRSRYKLLDPLLMDAASDLGAGPVKSFFKVLLPQLSPAVVSGMLMVFTMSFDDFSIVFFTVGRGAGTLPLKIYSMLKVGVTPVVNALSSLILLTSIILLFIAFWNQSDGNKKKVGYV